MNELKMTEIETLSWFELERLVNDLKKKHTKKGLTDLETKILKGIFEDKKYADLAEEIRQEEQSIKNAASSLFKKIILRYLIITINRNLSNRIEFLN
ncbi:MAG: hypothetical protein GPJ23_01485 [Microcystis aeruginosa G13-05]|nr:hypothetical protein [Microcystis aeruginosa G13-05]